MEVIPCQLRHAESIQVIFNEAILQTTAIYENEPRSLSWVESWMKGKQQNGYPLIGIEGSDGQIVAFATYGAFRSFPCYQHTIEHSIYVTQSSRGQGFGQILLSELIQEAMKAQYHTMIGVIDSANIASIQLHRKNSFRCCGTLRQAGHKFGQWLDVDLYQLIFSEKSGLSLKNKGKVN